MAKAVVRKPKKKSNPLKSAKIETVDYKDTALLRKFISDRGKIRARRVTGVNTQEQRQIAQLLEQADARYRAYCPVVFSLEQLKKSLTHDLLTGSVRVDPAVLKEQEA